MFICPRCAKEFDSYAGMARHTARQYNLKGQQLYREYHNITEDVLCKCGCGAPTKWTVGGYREYITGHNSKGNNNPMFGKTHSDQAKNSISSKRKQKFANGEYTFITFEKWSNAQKAVWATEGYKQYMKTAREKSGWREKLSDKMSGEHNPWYGKKRPDHSKLMKTPEMLGKVFAKRSMTNIEQKMAEMLNILNIEYHSQFFISLDDQIVSYDFKLTGFPLLIEVDGDYWHGGPGVDIHVPFVNEVTDKDKLKTQLAEQRGYTVLRFWGSDIINSPQQVITQLLQEINKLPL